MLELETGVLGYRGEIVNCPYCMSFIARLTIDIYKYDRLHVSDFESIETKVDDLSQAVCDTCGAYWYKNGMLCINGEWRK